MAASLRSNVILSTLAMVLVGVARLAFNAVINRIFGAEANGRAAALISLVFVCSLPATAAVPSVMVRHVSRALGAGGRDEAAVHARLAAYATLVLSLVGLLGVPFSGRFGISPPLNGLETISIFAGLLSECFWRVHRVLLVAIGEARASLRADLVSGGIFVAGLIGLVVLRRPELGVACFFLLYGAYGALTASRVRAFLRGGPLGREALRSFARYNVLWFLATAASLAAREIAILLLSSRESASAVGELSMALSLLSMMALAPRIIEVPLVHELSVLGGRATRDAQLRLTNQALEWLMVITFMAGFGAAILAGPILDTIGGVRTPEVVEAFVISALAFGIEMAVTPATNLLATESNPWVLTMVGSSSLLAAFLFWFSPFCYGTLGIAIGLALSFMVKGFTISGYARLKYGVRLAGAPLKAIAFIAGASVTVLVQAGRIGPWIAAIGFESALVLMFLPTLRAMLVSATGRVPARIATGDRQ